MFNAKHPSEFVVEEILPDGTVLEVGKAMDLGHPDDQTLERDYFTHFILQKTDWNTMQALGAIADQLHVKPGRFDFAGTKDKNAVTVQRCSAFAIAPARIKPAPIKDVQILGAWKARDKVKLGHLGGNRFTITLTEANCGKAITAAELEEKAASVGFKMKNFFGRQRFGSLRQNTAKVGAKMLAGDYEGAVWEYVAGEGPEPESFAQARRHLREEKDFAAAKAYFPGPLKYEKQLLWHLAEHSSDFIGALRKLPLNLQLMFVHAYQSELFNEYLAKNDGDFLCGSDALGFPDAEQAIVKEVCIDSDEAHWACAHIVGYDTQMSGSESKFMSEKGLSADLFKLKSMPSLSAKGTFRATHVPLKEFVAEDRVLEDGSKAVVVKFSLPSGSYATVALEQLLD